MSKSSNLQLRMAEIEKLIELLGDEKLQVLGRFLRERVDYPEHFVMMLGETSSGKTSLINGLIQSERFVTAARPTTGTVIELMDDPELEAEETFRVNNDATLEPVTLEQFTELSFRPDRQLGRLRLMIPQFPHQLRGLRLFDTPGYDSLFAEHEEVLKDFIPNSDVILYVVSYRVGFKENDHQFMQYIQTILPQTTEFVLVVNRVPAGIDNSDRRIVEIVQHAEDSLHRPLKCFLVRAIVQPATGESVPVLPAAEELWTHLQSFLLSPERQEMLVQSLLRFQRELLVMIQLEAEKAVTFAKVTQEDVGSIAAGLEAFLQKEEQVDEKIKTTFTKLNRQLPRLLDTAIERMAEKLQAQIEESNKWSTQDECTNFVQAHSLPLLVRQETKLIADYLLRELERLDAEIESLLNTAVEKFEYEIRVKASAFEPLFRSVSQKVVQNLFETGLLQFFAQYGGAGGAGAGVANAASHALKVLGDTFGHTFTRETHNSLTSFLSNIGATSARAISAASIVFVEAAFYVYDAMTWQRKLIKTANAALERWREGALSGIAKNLGELEAHNYERFHEYFAAYRAAFDTPEAGTGEIDALASMERIYQRASQLIAEFDDLIKEGN